MRSKLRVITALTRAAGCPWPPQSRDEPVPYSSPPESPAELAVGDERNRRAS